MKPIMLLLAASLAAAASGALAQPQGDACSNGYGSCMNRCASRPQSAQSSCSQLCEANSNRCYEGIYGTAPQDGPASASQAAPEPEARTARDQAKPTDKPSDKPKARAR